MSHKLNATANKLHRLSNSPERAGLVGTERGLFQTYLAPTAQHLGVAQAARRRRRPVSAKNR